LQFLFPKGIILHLFHIDARANRAPLDRLFNKYTVAMLFLR